MQDNELAYIGDEPRIRVASFIRCAARQLFWRGVVSAILVCSLLWLRMVCPEFEQNFDYAISIVSLGSIGIFTGHIISAWFKSGIECFNQHQQHLICNILLFGFSLIILASHFVIIYMAAIKLKYPSLPERGMYGDSFGALNSIVSTAALIGLWITVWLQFRENQENRRREWLRAKEEQDWRQEELKIQRQATWPILVITSVKGMLGPIGFDAAGRALVRGEIHVTYQNISNTPLFNVAPIVRWENFSNSCLVNESGSEVITYLPNTGKTIGELTIRINEFDTQPTDASFAFVDDKERAVKLQIIFTNAQGFAYLLQEELRINLANQKDIGYLREAAAAIQEAIKLCPQVASAPEQSRFAMYEKILKRKLIDPKKKLELTFKFEPFQHSLTEISNEQYSKLLGKCSSPSINGAV